MDDHTLLRDGLVCLLGGVPDVEVVGEAADAEGAVTAVESCLPDVVVLDAQLLGAQWAVSRALEVHPAVRVVLLTDDPSPLLAASMMAWPGVRGYLVKDVSFEQVVGAIRTVVRDDGRTVAASSQASIPSVVQQVNGLPRLTPRERDVLELVALALSNREIAQRLVIAEGTVHRHLSSMYRKLGATNRLDAVRKAVAAGLLGSAKVSTGNGRVDGSPA